MKLSVENFGPIKEADIALSPFTIIIGKNNIGKSYLAELFHVFYKNLYFRAVYDGQTYYTINEPSSYPRFFRYYYPTIQSRDVPREFQLKLNDSDIEALRKQLKNNNVKNSTICNRIIKIIQTRFKTQLTDIMTIALQQTYGLSIPNLIKLGENKSNILFELNNLNTIQIEFNSSGRFNLALKPNKNQLAMIYQVWEKHIEKAKSYKRLTKNRIDELVVNCLIPILTVEYEQSTFMPAGRAGLLEGYDTLVSALIELASIAPMYGISMPPITGLSSEFYNKLFALRGTRGPFSILAEDMNSLFHGNVSIRRPRGIPTGSGRLIYTFKMGEKTRSIPISVAASMIKELAPLYLYIRESLTEDSLLIIEEPESHVHPSGQMFLAELFCNLVLNKVHIMITTHSDLFLRKIGNLIGEGLTSTDEKIQHITSNNIRLYLISDNEDGSISTEIPIPEDGVFENIPEFDDVIEMLYDQQIKTLQKLQKKE